MAPSEAESTNDADIGAADGRAAGMADGGMAEAPPLGDEFTAGERRPGDGGLPSPGPGEAPASSKPRGMIGRLLGRRERRAATGDAPRTNEKQPKAPRRSKRKDGADLFADALQGLGSLLTSNPRHVPSGRYLQFSSAINGQLVDDAVAGTFVDTLVIQRAVVARERLDKLGAVLLPPLLIFQLESHPERAAQLLPILKMTLKHSAPLMLPAMRKVRQRAQAEQEAMDELAQDDPNYVPGTPIEDYILNLCFAGWEPPTPGDYIDADAQPTAQPQEAST